MKKRVQSPSSIILFKQCPRKYYYKYIVGLPESPSIHLVRGKIAHKVLEDFFDINTEDLNMKNYEIKLKQKTQELLAKHWKEAEISFADLNLAKAQIIFYFEETAMMLLNWLEMFFSKIKSFDSLNFQEIFQKLIPLREQHFISKELSVQGYIDTIEDYQGEIHIMDYKTSSHFNINEGYKLQLGIYALLYQEKHNKLPHKAGIYFLRFKPKFVSVDQNLIDFAKQEIEYVHKNTQSRDINDYPQNQSPLCKYRSGQCDFYEFCFGQKKLTDNK